LNRFIKKTASSYCLNDIRKWPLVEIDFINEMVLDKSYFVQMASYWEPFMESILLKLLGVKIAWREELFSFKW
jgi:hypothetical protein